MERRGVHAEILLVFLMSTVYSGFVWLGCKVPDAAGILNKLSSSSDPGL